MLSKLMYGLNFLLTGGNNSTQEDASWASNILAAITRVIDTLLWPIFGIVAALGIVYAIVLGVNYAKAETSDKKEEAKKRIINAVVGVVVMLALIVVIKVFINNIPQVKQWMDSAQSAGGGSN